MLSIPSVINFPNDNVPEKEKDNPKFGLNCARALYYKYYNYNGGFASGLGGANGVNPNGGLGYGFGDLQALRTIELYGLSKQPTQKYVNWFTNFSQIGATGGGSNSNKQGQTPRTDGFMGNPISKNARKAFANIDYTPVNPVDKFVNVILSILSEVDFKVDCTSTDETVIDERLRAKLEALYATRLVNPLAKELGQPMMETVAAPETMEEADVMEEIGLFKRKIEVAFETLAEHTFRISNWRNLRRFYNRNAVDFYYRCVKLYNCPETGAVKVKFIDIKDVIMLFTRDSTYEPPAIGHVEKKKVQDIYPDLVAAGFSDVQIQGMAQKYSYEQTNTYPDWTFQKPDPATGQWLWMDFQIPVMEFEYNSTNYKQYVRGRDKSGKEFYKKNEVPIDEKEKAKTKGREYDEFRCNTWYRGNYICGTDMIYGWEKMPNQLQKNKLNPVSSYVFDHIPGTAPTQKVISLCDDLMYGMLKLRAAVWAAPSPGFRIDIGAGANIKIGGQEYSIFDLIHLYRQNGILITASKFNAATGKVLSTPIEPIDGGLGASALGWINYCNNAINQIADMLGIPAVMAAQPDSAGNEKAVGVAEMEYMSGNHALYPIKESEILFKQRVAEKIILMTRMDIKYDKNIRKYYEGALGKDLIELLDTMDNMTLEQLGITMKSMPSQKRKDLMMQRLTELSKMGTRDGVMIVTPSELEVFEDLLNNDQLDAAKWFLGKCEEKALARAERNRTQATMETGQIQMESNKAAEAEKRQTQMEASRQRLAEIAAQGEEDRKTLSFKIPAEGQQKVALQVQKGEIENEQIILEGTVEAATGKDVKNPRND